MVSSYSTLLAKADGRAATHYWFRVAFLIRVPMPTLSSGRDRKLDRPPPQVGDPTRMLEDHARVLGSPLGGAHGEWFLGYRRKEPVEDSERTKLTESSQNDKKVLA